MRTTAIRRAGPFTIHSLANGHLRVDCAWPKDRTAETGPGVFDRLTLAEEVEALLNERAGKCGGPGPTQRIVDATRAALTGGTT